jgi:hypothetical protein
VRVSAWSEKLLAADIPPHIVKHLSVMTELNKQGRYDRMTDDLFKLTGRRPRACTTSSSCTPLSSLGMKRPIEGK